MQPHFSILGLTFYWYGLLLGLAIAVALVLIDYRAARFDSLDFAEKKAVLSSRKASLRVFFQQWSVALIISGFIGARLWHVATDWQLYRNNWFGALDISSGGLSILGAVLGGIIGLLVLRKLATSVRAVPAALILDALVFGLPIAQAIGRLGNWINQELYGLPTTLPWAIPIDFQYRLPGFEAIEYYHPLFLYEAVLLLILGSALWWIVRVRPHRFGTGYFALLYLASYSLIRFLLDFLRLDSPNVVLGLGINQLVLLLVFVLSSTLLVRRRGTYV